MQTQERQFLIHRRIALGDLPEAMACIRTWGGPGSRRPCQVCAETIVAGAVEYELDIDDGRTIVLCLPCYRIWRTEPPGA